MLYTKLSAYDRAKVSAAPQQLADFFFQIFFSGKVKTFFLHLNALKPIKCMHINHVIFRFNYEISFIGEIKYWQASLTLVQCQHENEN